MTLAEEHGLLEKLRVAMSLIETLKQEKDLIRENFDNLKEENESMEIRLEQELLERTAIQKEENRLRLDNEQNSILVHSLQNRLKELEDLKKTLITPKDMELKRMEFVSEIETKNKAKWKSVQEETDKFRTLYFEVRNDFELYKASTDNLKASHATALKELQLQHESQVTKLTLEQRVLQSQLADTSEAERLRQFQRSNNELLAQTKFQKREIEELRAQKEQLTVNNEQELRLANRKITEANAISKTFEAEKTALQTQLHHLEEELRQSTLNGDHLTQEVASLQNQLASLQSRYEEATHQYNVGISDTKLASVKQRADSEALLNQMRQKRDELETQIKSLQESLAQQRLRFTNAEKDHQKRIAELNQETLAKCEVLESEKNQLEHTITTIQQRLHEVKVSYDSKAKEWGNQQLHTAQEISKLNQQIEKLNQEKEEKASELDRQRAVNATNQETIAQLRAQVTSKSEKLEQQKFELKTQADELSIFAEKAAGTSAELSAIQLKLEQQQELAASTMQELESSFNLTSKDNEDLRQQVQELADKNELLLKRWQQLKQKYQNIKLSMSNTQLEASNAKKQLDAERLKAATQLKEFRKRQDNFMHLLQSEVLQNLPAAN